MDGYLVRFISKSADSIVWALVREDKDVITNKVTYSQVTTITLNRNSGCVCQDIYHVFAQNLVDQYHALVGAVCTEDVRKMVESTCKEHDAVPVGTAFFVPAASAELMRSMQAFVNQLGESELWLLPVFDSVESRESIAKACKSDLQEQINDIRAEVAAFSVEETRPSTLERRLRKFDELRSKASLYASLVSSVHDDLLGDISALETTVSNMLNLKKTCPTAR
jgi:hypothetical protein